MYELRDGILQKFDESQEMPYPVTSYDLENSIESYLPDKFLRFLNTLISGQKDISNYKEKVYHLLLSFTQDICIDELVGNGSSPNTHCFAPRFVIFKDANY